MKRPTWIVWEVSRSCLASPTLTLMSSSEVVRADGRECLQPDSCLHGLACEHIAWLPAMGSAPESGAWSRDTACVRGMVCGA